VPGKRPETLARAVAELRAQGRKALAVFAGAADPETERMMRKSVPSDGGDWVRVLGHTDAREALWASDVKILASEREGFPIAVVEAMACGVVPIRTPTEGSKDQIECGRDGFLFDVGDHSRLSKLIAMLMDQPQLRREMSAAAICKACRFDANVMADKVVSVYNELGLGSPPDPRCTCPAG
jgi:glycosyltransferase involved in cell wall biosynthesis